MKWCYGRDAAIEPTVGYHPEGDGFAERSMRTIMEKANTMRFGMKMGPAFWQLAGKHSVYVHNRQQVKDMELSPWEQWSGKRPSATQWKVFGCPAWVYIPKEKRKKLDPRAWEGIFVGLKEESEKIFLIWSSKEKRITEARFVKFDQMGNGVTDSDLISWEQLIEDSEMDDNETNDDDDESGNDSDEDNENNGVVVVDGTIDNEAVRLPNEKKISANESDDSTSSELTDLVSSTTISIEEGNTDFMPQTSIQQPTQQQTATEKRETKAQLKRLRQDEIAKESAARRQQTRGDGRRRRDQVNMMKNERGIHKGVIYKELTFKQAMELPDNEEC